MTRPRAAPVHEDDGWEEDRMNYDPVSGNINGPNRGSKSTTCCSWAIGPTGNVREAIHRITVIININSLWFSDGFVGGPSIGFFATEATGPGPMAPQAMHAFNAYHEHAAQRELHNNACECAEMIR